MSAASVTESIQTYAMRLGRAERLGIPSSALGPEWLKANEHWRRVLSRPEAGELRAQYVAAYRKARWESDAPLGDPQPANGARFLSEDAQPWRAEAALVKRSAEPDSGPAPLEPCPSSVVMHSSPSPSSPPSAPPSAPMPVPPAMPAKPKVGDTTADVTSARPLPLPFRPAHEVSLGVAPSTPPPSMPSMPAIPKAKVGDTTADVTSARSAALPFRPAHQVSLTLEQHAAYFAELALWPSSANAIHARYHLQDEARRLAELRHWALRRQEDRELNARWEVLFNAYARYYAAPR